MYRHPSANWDNNYGIRLDHDAFNYIGNNYITTYGEIGIGLAFYTQGSDNTISYNNITTYGPTGVGVYLWNLNNSLFYGNNIYTNGSIDFYNVRTELHCTDCYAHALWITSGTGSNFSGNTLQANNSRVVRIDDNNNNFTGNTILDSGQTQFWISSEANGTWLIDQDIGSYNLSGTGTLNIKKTGKGDIKFTQLVNGSGSNLSADIQISNNRAYVNTSANPGFANRAANVTLYGISYTDPKVQYSSDGVTFADCTSSTNPACNELGFSGNNFAFDVSHFSYFQSAEGYSAPANSGGSIGGGGSVPSGAGVVCTPSYVYGSWSLCTNGIRYRTVTDENGCVADYVKNRTCIVKPCVTDWQCSAWSACINNQSSRTCVDNNACNTSAGKPLEQITCNSGIECNIADINGDGSVNGGDMAILGSDWGTPDYCGYSDLNNDRKVNLNDLGMLGARWGTNTGPCRLRTLSCGNNPLIAEPANSTNGTLTTSSTGITGAVTACIPRINCGEWGSCSYGDSAGNVISGNVALTGIKTRICIDSNGCVASYSEEMPCQSNEEVEVNRQQTCGETTLTTKSSITGNSIASINLQSWKSSNTLDILFLQGNMTYCPHCYDGIKDNGETGIDCGGNCKTCAPDNYDYWRLFVISLVWGLSAVLFIFFLKRYGKYYARQLSPFVSTIISGNKYGI